MPEFGDEIKINNFNQINSLGEFIKINKENECDIELQSSLSGEREKDDLSVFSSTSSQSTSDIETETITSPNGDIIVREFNYKNKTAKETIKDKLGNITERIYDNPNNQKYYNHSEFDKSYYSHIKEEKIKYTDGYTISRSFKNGKLHKATVTFKNEKENISIDFDNIKEKELDIIKNRNLLLQKDINNKNFSANQILQMAKLKDRQWGKVKNRNILAAIDSQTKELSFYLLEELSEMSEKDWGNAEKRKLLYFKRNNGTKLLVDEIKDLAKISDAQWENIISRKIFDFKDENNDYFFVNKIIFLASFNIEEWDNLQERKLLSLKYPDGARLHNQEIKMLAQLSQEAWENIDKRNLFNIKDAGGNKFYIPEIVTLAKLTNKEWRNTEARELLRDRSNFRYIKVFAELDNEKWGIVRKSQLFDLNISYGKYFSEDEMKQLTALDKKYWDNMENRNLLKQSSLNIKDIIAAAKLNNQCYNNLKRELDKRENIGVPFFYIYERIKGQNSKIGSISMKGKKEKTYSSVLASLSGEEYLRTNKELYGEKPKEIEKLFEDFQKKYPDITLIADNDITEKEAVDLIQATEEFLKIQKKGNAPFAKYICYTKLGNMSGFYDENKIFVNLLPSGLYQELDKISFLDVLIHENGHHKDYTDKDFKEIPIPNEIKLILKKVFRDYAIEDSSESIAVLTEAIEMPDDKDGNPLTSKMRLRKDKKGNYILMISKNTNLTKEEVDKLGIYFRSIRCPELIPDYDENIHGNPDNYYETVIRKKKGLFF